MGPASQKKYRTIGFIFFLISVFSHPLFALPENPQVSSGEAQFNQVDDHTLNITASSQSIIEYGSFNIASHESVNFILPSIESFSLNRVVGNTPTEIYGALTANGNLILINTQGILFGPTSMVQVGGLIASTRDITNQDFLNRNYLFGSTDETIQDTYSSVINQGLIETRDQGFAVLIGSHVAHEGTITAPLGTAALASGD